MTLRRLLLFAAFLPVLFAQAQDRQTLRDSLKMAIERLSYHPDSVDLRLQKAAWNMQLEEWDNAKYEYDWVLQHDPDNPAALFFRAYANERLHRHGFARIDYENLLAVVPAHFEGRLGLALLHQKDHRLTEAMNQMNVLVQQYPDSAIAYAARAGMEAERQMLAPAIYDYTEALARDADNADYLLARADLYIRERQFEEARRDLSRLVSLGVAPRALEEFYRRLPK